MFNQIITNIHLEDTFTTSQREFKEVNKKVNSFLNEALIKKKRQ